MRLKRAFFLMFKRWPFWQRFGMWDFLYGRVTFSEVRDAEVSFSESRAADVSFAQVRTAEVTFSEVP